MDGRRGQSLPWALLGLCMVLRADTAPSASPDYVMKVRDPALSNRTYGADDPIVFPESKPFQPECMADFCETVRNYPSETELHALLRDIPPAFEEYVHSDEQAPASNESVAIRSGRRHGTELQPLCQETEHFVPLQAAKDINDKKMHFIAQTSKIQQMVRIVTCSHVDKLCDVGDPIREPKCTQQYASRKLLGANEARRAVLLQFSIPSGCACMFKSKGG